MIEKETYNFRIVSFPLSELCDNFIRISSKNVYGIEKRLLFSKHYALIRFNNGLTAIEDKQKAFVVYEAILNSSFLIRFFIRLSKQPIPIKNL